MIDFQEGWQQILEKGVKPLEQYLEARHRISDTSDFLFESECENSSNEHAQSSIHSTTKPVFSTKDSMQLYTLVYTMSTQREKNFSKKLYEAHSRVIKDYIQRKVLPALKDKTGLGLLKEMYRRWEDHKIFNSWMEKIFSYLDRYYVRANMELRLKQKGLQIFNKMVFSKYEFQIRELILQKLNKEREGEHTCKTVIRSLAFLFVELDADTLRYYVDEFEQHLLLSMKEFYSQKADLWISQKSFADYLRQVLTVLQDEAIRCKNYFHEQTWSKILIVLHKTLLSAKVPQLLTSDTGIKHLLINEAVDDIKSAYELFKFIDEGTLHLAKHFQDYILNEGQSLVAKYAKIFFAEVESIQTNKNKNIHTIIQRQLYNTNFTQELLSLYERMTHLTVVCFNQELIFKHAIKEAFESFLSKDVGYHSTVAYLSSYCDQLLRKHNNISSGTTKFEQLDKTFEKIVDIFTYLTDKDLFADVYRAQLAQRLLSDSWNSMSAECLVINKIKIKCGPQFTSKFEGMLNDIRSSIEIQEGYDTYISNNPDKIVKHSKIDTTFNVYVLSTGYWPLYQAQDIVLPSVMKSYIDSFLKYYLEIKTSHRQLKWMHQLGSVILTASFTPNTSFTIRCNTLQACVLLLFNDFDKLSLSYISETLKVDPTLVKMLLAALIVARLIKKDKSEHGEYVINTDFTSEHKLIQVPIPLQDRLHCKDKVEEDRSIAIEAAIMRIMKTKKQCEHCYLINEVISQLQLFKPNPRLIKARIESLIEREFIQRSNDNVQQYKYLT